MQGTGRALRWAAQQPWIDVITNSWGNADQGNDDASRAAVASGKIVCFAAGNQPAPLWHQPSQGPSWNVLVGAVRPDEDAPAEYSGWPVDVVGRTSVPAASPTSFSDAGVFTGTSASAPQVCGLMARGIAQLRTAAGDTREGPHDDGRLVVAAPGAGALVDGTVVRSEIEDAFEATASPLSATPGRFVREGYGLVARDTFAAALAVLSGDGARPERSTEDEWQARSDAARDAVYGPPP